MMKNILVVGASSGIGKEIADQLIETNNRVYATWRNKEIDSRTEFISWHRLDVMDELLSLDFLPEELHGFVYCPGSINLRPFERIKPVDFEKDFQLQVMGAVRILQAIIPKLKKSGNASVVLFSTVAVQTGFPFHAQVAASKGAIEGLTRSLAAEYSPRIRFNCIAPSLTDTPLAGSLLNTEQKRELHAQSNPLKRIGTVQDMAAMALFLLSDKAGWITAQIMHVDGGVSGLKK
jgi:NAD(P)-dependent dehydrogenase (short-subunit alcohol dehydrogenase family)